MCEEHADIVHRHCLAYLIDLVRIGVRIGERGNKLEMETVRGNEQNGEGTESVSVLISSEALLECRES